MNYDRYEEDMKILWENFSMFCKLGCWLLWCCYLCWSKEVLFNPLSFCLSARLLRNIMKSFLGSGMWPNKQSTFWFRSRLEVILNNFFSNVLMFCSLGTYSCADCLLSHCIEMLYVHDVSSWTVLIGWYSVSISTWIYICMTPGCRSTSPYQTSRPLMMPILLVSDNNTLLTACIVSQAER